MTKRMEHTVLAVMGFGLTAARIARADPFVQPRFPWILLLPLALPLEALVIAWMAGPSVVRKRFVLAWVPVTVATFAGMVWLIGALQPRTGLPIALIVGEAAVVLVEAWCIHRMLGHPAWVVNPERRPGAAKALGYSLAANLASFIAGAVLTAMASTIR